MNIILQESKMNPYNKFAIIKMSAWPREARHAVAAVERGSNISLHSFTSRPLARFPPSRFLVEIRLRLGSLEESEIDKGI